MAATHGPDVGDGGSDAGEVAPAPRHVGLAFAAAPLGVFVLAQLVFELAGRDLAALAGPVPDPSAEREIGARVLWAASVLVFHVAALGAIAASLALLARHVPARLRARYATAWAAVTAGALAHLAWSSAARNAFSGIYFYTHDRLAGCGCIEPGDLALFTGMEVTVNVLAAVAPMLLLLATCAVLEPGRMDGPPALHDMQQRMRRLKRLLNLASVLLVAGMLNMTLWLRWPGAVAGEAAATATDAVTFYWGTVFTLVVVALYVPASMELNRRAEALLGRFPEARGSARDTAEWLERHGLSLTPTQQLPQVMAMLAPMLAGSVGSGIAGFPGALTGG